MAADFAFLNGEFLPVSEARVSIEDRGFQFGDGLFEVVRRYPGGLLELPRHLRRMARSAESLGFAVPYSVEQMAEFACELARKNDVADGELYIQVTRGAAPRRHYFPDGATPTVVMTLRPVRPINPEYRIAGAPAVTFPDIRWGWCHLKTINLLPNVLAKQAAREAGVYEALFVRDGGLVTEGASSNIFLWEGRTWVTPALHNILPGVTREVVIELIRAAGLPLVEEHVPLERLLGAGEAFLTSTVSEVMPLVSVDGRAIGSGVPGDKTRQLRDLFTSHISGHLTMV